MRPTSSLKANAERLRSQRQAKQASAMFSHPIPSSAPALSKWAGVSPGAVVGGIGGAHGSSRSGGGVATSAVSGLVGGLVGDAVYEAIAKAILSHDDKGTREMAVPLALLASTIAGQVSGAITKKWLVGDSKKERRNA